MVTQLTEVVSVAQVMSFLAGALTSLLVTLLAAIWANILTRRRERRRIVEERRFDVYMKMLELCSTYFWVTSAEERGEPIKEEIRGRCYRLAWQIADILRSVDEMEFLDDILQVIMAPDFPTAVARYEAMGDLVDRMGKRVNPRYYSTVQSISQAHLHRFLDPKLRGSTNAPASMGPFGPR